MSFGLHRLWKQAALQASLVRPGQHVLDVAGGTGDLTNGFLKCIGETGYVCLTDINASMLNVGRNKLLDLGQHQNLSFIQADAENLPFIDNHFDCVSIAFGLRNVTRKENALASMYRILKPGGRLIVLEFSKPILPILAKLYDRYSFSILPKLGQWVTGSADSYQYLVESIRKHPDQETLQAMIVESGFDQCDYMNLTGGVVCIHRAIKA